MRVRARKDDNHKEIAAALIKIGASVLDTSQLGNGAPDIIVGFRGQNVLVEIKDGDKPPSKRRLTPDEVKFQLSWQGNYKVVNSVDEALKLLFTIIA